MSVPLDDCKAAAEPSRRERITASCVCALVFVIIYFLSAGPMAALHSAFEFKQFRDALEIVYGPLIVLGESDLEPVSSLVRSYIGLFR